MSLGSYPQYGGLCVCSQPENKIGRLGMITKFLDIRVVGKLIQWGFEIRTSLDFESSKRGWVAKGPDLEWDLKS